MHAHPHPHVHPQIASDSVVHRLPAGLKFFVTVMLVLGVSLLPRPYAAFLMVPAGLLFVAILIARLPIVAFFKRLLMLEPFVLGVALMALGFFSLLAILSFLEVSFVVPVSALSYAAGAFGAKAFLGERISRNRWLGIAVVCIGVTIVWWSGR